MYTIHLRTVERKRKGKRRFITNDGIVISSRRLQGWRSKKQKCQVGDLRRRSLYNAALYNTIQQGTTRQQGAA